MARFLSTVGLLASVAAGEGLNFPFPHNDRPQPFKVSVDPQFIHETAQKVAWFRPTIPLHDDEDWADGPPASSVNALAEHWKSQYDWFAVQEEINTNFSHYATTVPGSRRYEHPIPLHFVHEPSSREDAVPLVLLHGWPSTHLEWSKVMGPLAHPSGDSQLAFHVVALDIPGYGFSPAPKYPGLGPQEIGDMVDALMKQLGYTSYGVVSTDLGWMAAMWMVNDHKDSIIGHFTDFFLATPNATDLDRFEAGETTPDETRYMKGYMSYQNENSGYADIHRTRPLQLAYGMTDSPVGYTAWVWQLLKMASMGNYDYSFDDIITTSMVLWIQGTYGNVRAYKELMVPSALAFPQSDVPTAVTEWSGRNATYPEIALTPFVPRDWIERYSNVQYFKRHHTGGHFPAIAVPKLWVHDVREFFTQLT